LMVRQPGMAGLKQFVGSVRAGLGRSARNPG
jgi:hypothetical protein